jgi:hypothetical protein
MKINNLLLTPEFVRLDQMLIRAKELNPVDSYDLLHKNAYVLLEIYHWLRHCNQMIIKQKMDETLQKYVVKPIR